MILGIDIGGTKTLLAVFKDSRDDHEIVFEKKHPTDKDYQKFIKNLNSEITQLRSDYDIQAIGVAGPGKTDDSKSKFTNFGNLSWENIPIKKDIEKAVSLPVVIENDANVGAIGEARIGAGQDFKEVLYITISTGIGIGVTVNKEIDKALANSEAGHAHFNYQGSLVKWESVASGRAFYETYGLPGSDCDNPEIWEEFSTKINLGLEPLIAIIGPDVVVIGGSMGEHLHKYRDFLIEQLSKNKSKMVKLPEIIAASNPDHAVIYGCKLIAQDLLCKKA